MKIYHGGYTVVEIPEMRQSKFPKDFGDGFYCTELEEQAVRWANRYDICFCTEKSLNALQFVEANKIK
ncbi:MAG: DUF3990 domain-containing protein [Bacteroidales bacterium]|nr:DUF3990 domain-containing protein [Bacteroidales bacterium]